MALKVYGASDDLIEVEGDLREEYGSYKTDSVMAFSDGTRLIVSYGPLGIWKIVIDHRGELLDRIVPCFQEGVDGDEKYSDVAYFKDGIKWVTRGEHK